MNTTAIFIIGTLIFSTYMFFLVRMIWKQHKIQELEEKRNNFKLTKVEGGLRDNEIELYPKKNKSKSA
ncbi:MAG: hypothetical protein MK078_13070 [Crocinitomicaceae bacterium]|nr:hypothetical protein [Crocinitomicaceae bacterium]